MALPRGEDLPRSCRYDVEFWGKAGGRRKAGRKRAGTPAGAADDKLLPETLRNNQWDLQRCRCLLVELDDEDLRARLLASRWNAGGSGKALVADMASGRALDDRWLKEAAAAFNVDTKRNRQSKSARDMPQEQVAEAVLTAVRQSRAALRQPASARDEARRMRMRDGWRTAGDIQAAAGRCGSYRRGVTHFQLQNSVFVRTCPEQLRLEVVEEFVDAQGRLPHPNTAGEEFAAAYVESALARRHVSCATGEQLTGLQVGRWCAFFNRIPEDVRPVWVEDLAKQVLTEFYQIHGHLEVAGPVKDRSTEETELVKALRERAV